MNRLFALALAAVAVAACQKKPAASDAAHPSTGMPAIADRFSYADPARARVAHLDLDLDVSFEAKALEGSATLTIERPDPKAALVLDTNDLVIRSVEAGVAGALAPTAYALGEDHPDLGSKLEITLPDGADTVRIAYRTSPDAAGLQWVAPAATAGKARPFMYSQNQAINARSMAPVQDTPAVRMTYRATIRTPKDLLAVMSAGQDAGPRDGVYEFDMPQPIPAYLLAIAVGDLAFRPLSETMGVYAEPSVVDAAAAEFSDTPAMEKAAAALYGAYRWGRYDLLVLPPSFPFGGMENPRLSFLTPTLIAGDKSLTGVVAHELAHSWSGNLVTNASWSDIWLNEGVTSYVENRIIEAVYGVDRAVMDQALALAELKDEIANIKKPTLTQLALPDDIESADGAIGDVAYIKGEYFLRFLETRYGRAAFDAFLKSYFDKFAFEAVTTEDFIAHLKETLVAKNPGAAAIAEIEEWAYGQGLPASVAAPSSAAFDQVTAAQRAWLAAPAPAPAFETAAWTTQQWLHFVNTLPDDLAGDRMAALDAAFALTASENAEIAFAWYMKSLEAGYAPAKPAIAAFLTRVGRGKFIYPLYTELKKRGDAALAAEVYAKAKTGYHPIAQKRIEGILEGKE